MSIDEKISNIIKLLRSTLHEDWDWFNDDATPRRIAHINSGVAISFHNSNLYSEFCLYKCGQGGADILLKAESAESNGPLKVLWEEIHNKRAAFLRVKEEQKFNSVLDSVINILVATKTSGREK